MSIEPPFQDRSIRSAIVRYWARRMEQCVTQEERDYLAADILNYGMRYRSLAENQQEFETPERENV